MEAIRPSNNLSASTMQSLGLKLHDKVVVSGKIGTLRYCGSTDFASGQWAGIELQNPVGKNDGSMAGKRYFNCAPKHGIFAPLTRVISYGKDEPYSESKENSFNGYNSLIRGYSDEGPVATSPFDESSFFASLRRGQSYEDKTAPVSPYKNYDSSFFNTFQSVAELNEKPKMRTVSFDISPMMFPASSSEIKVDDKVLLCGQKMGIVRYIGPTTFATGTWVGVELVEAVGKNDGTVAGFRYFICNPKHGIFAPIIKVQKITDDEFFYKRGRSGIPVENCTSPNSKLSNHNAMCNSCGGETNIGEEKTLNKSTPNLSNERILSTPNILGGKDLPLNISTPNLSEEKILSTPNIFEEKGMSLNISTPNLSEEKRNSLNEEKKNMLNRSTPNLRRKSSSIRKTSETDDLDMDLGKTLDFRLTAGMLVYHNNNLAILRYIGEVDFAEGVWLGIELRKPKGKNDGKVERRRYFSCPTNHGLMVRPNRTWCHGINCAQLISSD